ncbi:MAG: non-hydrolyzing UDP-N-acetylglucosamine 2-epimerase [Candidatus Woesearchaeota archaeon]
MIHIILGTKAQLIKMAPIMVELKNQKINYNFIFTGQHKETMNKLLENFNIKKPDYVLYSGKDITGIFQMFVWMFKIMFKLIWNKNKIFKKDKKGIVLVHGDTFSTLLGAFMAKIARLKVGHIESGLRSFNLFNPFPEELTRIFTFKLTDYYFCAGNWAKNNVKKYKGIKINTEENTLLDSLNLAIKNQKNIFVEIPKEKYVVVTIHRFENIFQKKQFNKIIAILEEISKKHRLLFILHPPTKKKLEEFNFLIRLQSNKNIELRPRYDYFEFVKLINHAEFVISDGGSNQEECYYLGKPCLLLRYSTERKEGVGQNVVLSKFNLNKIKYFSTNYKQYKFDFILNENFPSKLIIEKLKEFTK